MSLRYLFLLLFVFFALAASAQRPQPFEGIITYLVRTELKQDSNSVNKHYAQKYGDTLTVYYLKNGSERKEYNNTGPYGLEYEIFNKISNENYTKWHDLDYVVYASASDTLTQIDSLSSGELAFILGDTCRSISSKNTDLKTGDTSYTTQYFSGNEYILPHTYQKRKAGHFDKLYSMSESLFLQWIIDMQFATTTFTAISIERKPLDPNLFIISSRISKVKK